MNCTAKLPVDEIISAVKASISLGDLGGVAYAELEELVVNYTQKQIDAIHQKILDLAPEKYVVSQGLEGYTFSTTLNDGTVLTTDMRLLVGSIVEEVGATISVYATKEELQQIQTDLSQDISSVNQNVSTNTAAIATKASQSDLDATNANVTANTNAIANKANKTDVIDVVHGGTGAKTLAAAQTNLGILDNKVLLPQKIGSSQRWYQSGLRHGADYPYPYLATTLTTTNGYQYFVPFTALEDATITALEIYCSTAQSNATVSLGIYASDSNNDLSSALFTSNQIDCSAAGAKNAPCNVSITKGKVYWLSSMAIGTPAFYRNATDSLMPIKGTTVSSQSSVIGYYTTGNTSMAQSAPTNKLDMANPVPRVMFVVS